MMDNEYNSIIDWWEQQEEEGFLEMMTRQNEESDNETI